MSVITKRGDEGMTDLMFGARLKKSDCRVEAGGMIDELNACLGLVRAEASTQPLIYDAICRIQEHLIGLMGEMACLTKDWTRYLDAGYLRLEEKDLQWLENWISEREAELNQRWKDWARPGAERNVVAAQLDFARTVARRAERAVWRFVEIEPLNSSLPLLYLNRLSDACWVMARFQVHQSQA